jgi:ATP-dependent Clp protease ATP-binding subunit ClpA
MSKTAASVASKMASRVAAWHTVTPEAIDALRRRIETMQREKEELMREAERVEKELWDKVEEIEKVLLSDMALEMAYRSLAASATSRSGDGDVRVPPVPPVHLRKNGKRTAGFPEGHRSRARSHSPPAVASRRKATTITGSSGLHYGGARRPVLPVRPQND